MYSCPGYSKSKSLNPVTPLSTKRGGGEDTEIPKIQLIPIFHHIHSECRMLNTKCCMDRYLIFNLKWFPFTRNMFNQHYCFCLFRKILNRIEMNCWRGFWILNQSIFMFDFPFVFDNCFFVCVFVWYHWVLSMHCNLNR